MVEVYGPYIATLVIGLAVAWTVSIILLLKSATKHISPEVAAGEEALIEPPGQTMSRVQGEPYVRVIPLMLVGVTLAYLYPWALNFPRWLTDETAAIEPVGAMGLFGLAVGFGIVYLWKRGAVDSP